MKEKENRRGRERGDQVKIKRYGCLDFDMELWFCMDFLSRYMFVGYGL